MSSVSYVAQAVRLSYTLGMMSGGLARRIRDLREARNISQETLGRACGVTRAAVAQWEKGTSAPTLDKLEALTHTLETDAVYLLQGDHIAAPRKGELVSATVPVVEYDVRVSAGGGFHISDETKRDVWLFSRRYLADELRLSPSRLVVLEVVGDSMEPTLKSGDRVLVNMADTRVSQPGIFVLWDGDGTVVKRLELVPSSKPPVLKRISDNPLHGTYDVPAVDTKIIGRVVWIARRA